MKSKSRLNSRIVSSKRAVQFARKNNLEYFEVSAKEDVNIDEIFLEMTFNVLEKIENKEINASRENGIKLGTLENELENPNKTIVLKKKVLKSSCCLNRWF